MCGAVEGAVGPSGAWSSSSTPLQPSAKLLTEEFLTAGGDEHHQVLSRKIANVNFETAQEDPKDLMSLTTSFL